MSTTLSPARARRLAAAALVACACAAPRQAWRETAPPEVLVEVVPRAAELSVDGTPLGAGPRAVAVPDAARVYRFRAAAPGFAPAERSGAGAALAGTRVGLVLAPEGFGAGGLDLEDGAGLGAAGAVLERSGRHAAAIEYAERALQVAPDAALPRRVLGDAYYATGRRRQAAVEYSAYVNLAPRAPDRVAVERRIRELRGDISMPREDR